MNKLAITMGAITLPLAITGCQSNNGGSSDNVIEKPEIEVVDGMMTPEVLESFGQVNEATPSPDGSKIAFTLKYESIEENKGNAEIYLMNADGSGMKRLTTSAASEHNLQWIENGERLAFLCKDDDMKSEQIFSINKDGGDRKRHSKVEAGIESFKISPDGNKVIYASAINTFNRDSTVYEGLPKTSGMIVNDLGYKHWDEWVTKIPHPYLADFGQEMSEGEDIMNGEPFEAPVRPFGGAESFAWTPDSKQLVYVSRKLTGKDYVFSTDTGLYLYDLASKKTSLLTEGMPGYDTDPMFSPDGKQLAWLSMATPKYESDKKRLMVLDMQTRQMRDLTENWDWWPEGMAWAPDGKSIFFHGYQGGTEPMFRINVADCTVETLSEGVFDYASVAVLNNDKVVGLRRSMTSPNEIYEVSKAGAKALTDINGELLGKLKKVTVEKKLVPTTDGKEMTTWVILPPDFDPNKKYPALLYCQGGPQQAVSQFWSYRWNFMIMASHGYIVIAPNRRGVPGFGEEWNRQISGDYGGQNMKDYLSAVDYMTQESYIDKEHVGAIGASYGGFSVYWLAGHHEGRFAALIAHAGIFNIEAQYLETEEMWFADFDMGGAPWEKDNATAQRTFANSPHKFVDKWTAPMLITVGELDYRILASQGMMAFNACRMRGIPTEMLVFPDENHWVLQPQNAILWQRVFFRFLDTYLKPGSKPRYANPEAPLAPVSVYGDRSYSHQTLAD